MRTRRVVGVVCLLLATGSFALVLKSALDAQRRGCERFHDLAAECFSTNAMMMAILGVIFFLALVTLAVLVLGRPDSTKAP